MTIFLLKLDYYIYLNGIKTILKMIFGVLILSLILLLVKNLYKKIGLAEKEKTEITKISKDQAVEIAKLKIQLLDQLQVIKEKNNNYQELQLLQTKIKVDAKNEILLNDNDNIEVLKNFNLAQKENWQDFKKTFTTIYPNFENNINSKISSISSAESRLLMLHKLGLSSKEISNMLLISPNGVKKAKYRLYKKIGINKVQELDNFVDKLL